MRTNQKYLEDCQQAARDLNYFIDVILLKYSLPSRTRILNEFFVLEREFIDDDYKWKKYLSEIL